MMQEGIRTSKLSVGYDGRAVLENIDISIVPGQILTLIGPNGAGKSTILKTLTRELSPVGGSIYLSGMDMKDIKAADIAKEMSMVMTSRPAAELMTCRDIVATGRYPYTGRMGILSEEDWKLVEEAMECVRATDTADKLFDRVSDGQRQRVMLAKALCQEPKILLLDEPTSYLDIRFKLDILTTIRHMVKERKLAVVMSLHELELARGISDVIACVQDNHIGRVGSPEEVFSGGYIQKLYGIDEDRFDESTGMLILPKWGD